MISDLTSNHIVIGNRAFIKLEAIKKVLILTLTNSKKRSTHLRHLESIQHHNLQNGIFIDLAEIPDSTINATKLTYEYLISSLKLFESNELGETEIKIGMIFQLVKDAIEDEWVSEWYKYQEYETERSIRYARKHVLINLFLTKW